MSRLVLTTRLYACDTGTGGCGKPTGWRDISCFPFEIPVCSEECLAAMDAPSEAVVEALRNARVDDEPLSDEDIAAIEDRS
jgi:hypothetical protein